ncbi:hypothetical protein B6I21_05830, partial [candidate division KSB1 bacterium 4572_119]
AEAYLILGKSYRALNDMDKALANLKIAFSIKPYSSITRKTKDEIIMTRLFIADKALKNKSYNIAFSEYKEALKLDSTNFRANYQLATAYNENKWLEKAKHYFQKAQQINTSDSTISQKIENIDKLTEEAEVQFQKGKKFYQQKKNISARKYLKRALNKKGDHKDAQYFYHMAEGKILYRKGSKSELWDAIEHFGKAMIIRENSAEPHFYLGKAYEKKNRNEFDNAIEEYQQSIKKEPDGPFAMKSRKKVRELKARQKKMKKFWGK